MLSRIEVVTVSELILFSASPLVSISSSATGTSETSDHPRSRRTSIDVMKTRSSSSSAVSYTSSNCAVYCGAPDHVITNGTAPEYLHSVIGAREEKRGKRRETFSYQWESVRGPITIST